MGGSSRLGGFARQPLVAHRHGLAHGADVEQVGGLEQLAQRGVAVVAGVERGLVRDAVADGADAGPAGVVGRALTAVRSSRTSLASCAARWSSSSRVDASAWASPASALRGRRRLLGRVPLRRGLLRGGTVRLRPPGPSAAWASGPRRPAPRPRPSLTSSGSASWSRNRKRVQARRNGSGSWRRRSRRPRRPSRAGASQRGEVGVGGDEREGVGAVGVGRASRRRPSRCRWRSCPCCGRTAAPGGSRSRATPPATTSARSWSSCRRRGECWSRRGAELVEDQVDLLGRGVVGVDEERDLGRGVHARTLRHRPPRRPAGTRHKSLRAAAPRPDPVAGEPGIPAPVCRVHPLQRGVADGRGRHRAAGLLDHPVHGGGRDRRAVRARAAGGMGPVRRLAGRPLRPARSG